MELKPKRTGTSWSESDDLPSMNEICQKPLMSELNIDNTLVLLMVTVKKNPSKFRKAHRDEVAKQKLSFISLRSHSCVGWVSTSVAQKSEVRPVRDWKASESETRPRLNPSNNKTTQKGRNKTNN